MAQDTCDVYTMTTLQSTRGSTMSQAILKWGNRSSSIEAVISDVFQLTKLTSTRAFMEMGCLLHFDLPTRSARFWLPHLRAIFPKHRCLFGT